MDAGKTRKKYLVKAGRSAKLPDPEDKGGFDGDKDMAAAKLEKLGRRLADLQTDLYAEKKRKVLIVLQGMDTSGKDGTIRHVFQYVNPQGVNVASFKKPNDEEAAHDFLWRIHRHTPAAGEITIFNRSHYEDVVAVRARGLAPKEVWRKRFGFINAFEEMLAAEGATVIKFFLHIDREEQAGRLRERLEDPDKRWKFDPSDLEDRKLWGAYAKAYSEALARTSTEWAPWYAVPANSKWYRNLVVATILVDVLAGLRIKRPRPDYTPEKFPIK
jgi:PPK2 family polyphosphate:nucleotide phosphotransferase